MLEIRDLAVEIDGRQLLHDINMTINAGETHVLFGPNGSGKTSLIMTIMGFPRYKITRGHIWFKGQDITDMPLDERARMGIGMSFQRPPAIRGMTLRAAAQACLRNNTDGAPVEDLAAKLGLNEFLDRDLNYSFSGGELKRSELLQLLAQDPELILFDEPESGVDLVSISLIGSVINELLQEDSKQTRCNCGLIITHTGHILDYVHADKGHCMIGGTLACEGDPLEILERIRKNGYDKCTICLR